VGTQAGVTRLAGGRAVHVPFWGRGPRFPVVAGTHAADGSLWFATDGGGVVRVTAAAPGAPGPPYQTAAFTRRDGLTDDRAIAILTDHESNVWVGTRLGLNRFHPVPIRALTTRDGLPAEAMGAMLRDAAGRVWLAPASGGVYRGRVVAGRAEFTAVAPPAGGRAMMLYAGRDGRVWAGWERGGVTAYPAAAGVTARPLRLGAADGIAPGSVYAMAEDSAGAVWVATRTA
jgi:ligand-binding sensor domain-containing protein